MANVDAKRPVVGSLMQRQIAAWRHLKLAHPATLPVDAIYQADILVNHCPTLLDDPRAISYLASSHTRAPSQATIIDAATERAVVGPS